MKTKLVVSHSPKRNQKAIIDGKLSDKCMITYLDASHLQRRSAALAHAELLLTASFSQAEITPAEVVGMRRLRHVQLIFAGGDNVPFDRLPARVTVAGNPGAFAEPLAEHVAGLALCLAKWMLPNHRALARGEFGLGGSNTRLAGGVCGIVGMGGNGKAVARRMRALGMRIRGINRHAEADDTVDWMGTPADLPALLAAADVLVLTVPLTPETHHLIKAPQLQQMKPDAILINVARGVVVQQPALYHHLQSNPRFRAGIDTWWSEPDSHGRFEVEHPFFDLPNFIGSPHNADVVPGAMTEATRLAVMNLTDYLAGRPFRGKMTRPNR